MTLDALERVNEVIRNYRGTDDVLARRDTSAGSSIVVPFARGMDETDWWICMELAWGETCDICWESSGMNSCTRPCVSCYDKRDDCDHHGIERWSPALFSVRRRMAAEIIACL